MRAPAYAAVVRATVVRAAVVRAAVVRATVVRAAVAPAAAILAAALLPPMGVEAQELLSAGDVVRMEAPAPHARIAYGPDPLQFGHLRLPEGAGPHPVVIFVHGGCWLSQYGIGAAKDSHL